MTKDFELSEELKELAKQVLDKEKLDVEEAKIGYLLVDPYISKTTVGRCIRANKELKFFSKFDYIIEMSKEVWEQLDDKTKYVLMFHELLHVFIEHDEKTGEVKFLLKDHDVKDFYTIIKQFGIEWFSGLKTQVASIYDFEKEEDINI